jgi:hypothetical protein
MSDEPETYEPETEAGPPVATLDEVTPLAVTPEILTFGMSGGFLGATINMATNPTGPNIASRTQVQLIMAPTQADLESRCISTLISEFGMTQTDARALIPSAMQPLVSGSQYLPLVGGKLSGNLVLDGGANANSPTVQLAGWGATVATIGPDFLNSGLQIDIPAGSFNLNATVTDGIINLSGSNSAIQIAQNNITIIPGGTGNTQIQKELRVQAKVSFWGAQATAPAAKPAVAGAWAGNTAGKALCVALASYGLITDSTTA